MSVKPETTVSCPVCDKIFLSTSIEEHVNKCLFLNSKSESISLKRPPTTSYKNVSSLQKKAKLSPQNIRNDRNMEGKNQSTSNSDLVKKLESQNNQPLAEKMRPSSLNDYIGQDHVLGNNKMLRLLIDRTDIPSMILWGPPGCGKTSLANVIASICKSKDNMRFIKLSATMAGISDVKDVVMVAKNETKFKRKTILFMDEIHRFNKLQQDTFLPHVENGTIILIGATTENPSFNLNSALLSRCRVILLEKLTSENILFILIKALEKSNNDALITDPNVKSDNSGNRVPRILIEKKSLEWLSEVTDGDARVALNSLQLAMQSKDPGDSFEETGPAMITLDDIKEGVKRSSILYDKKGEEHYNLISALHKSIRASDDNAALYWVTRMMESGEDPIYIARRLIRVAGEDIGLADPSALQLAVSCMQACQMVGMPECDVFLAECAVYLARSPKSQEVYKALSSCQFFIKEHKGPIPSVPFHLRNAPTKLMSQMGYGKGYNMKHKDESNLKYLPEGMEEIKFL